MITTAKVTSAKGTQDDTIPPALSYITLTGGLPHDDVKVGVCCGPGGFLQGHRG